jgi:hypothetical protein
VWYFVCIFIFLYAKAFFSISPQAGGIFGTIRFAVVDLGGNLTYPMGSLLLLAVMWASPLTPQIRDNIGLQFLSSGLLIMSIGAFIVAFANGIYPRLKYNFGGGQPQIAQIVIEGGKEAKALIGNAPGVFTDPPPTVCDDSATPSSIEAAVIWYQSEKYIYFSTWPPTKGIKSIALDAKAVKFLRYLPAQALFESGGKIEAITCEKKTG